MRGKLRFSLVLILIAAAVIIVPFAAPELTVNPQKYDISKPDFNKTYNVIITLINPDTEGYDMHAVVDKESSYLAGYVHIDPVLFRMEPLQKKNIQLSLTIPDTISPEKHTLYLDFMSANRMLGRFQLSFTVSGKQVEALVLEKVTSAAQEGQSMVYFNFQVKNTGNVIARGSPIVEIYRDGSLLDTFGDESSLIIMPGQEYNLSLLYDTTNDEPGEYGYAAKFSYNGLETNYTRGTFAVSKKPESQSAEERDVPEGGTLEYDIRLSNPGQKLSFYSITYNMTGQNVSGKAEGEMQGKEKTVSFEIDTSHLPPGTYDLDLGIRHGERLENYEQREVEVTVTSGRSQLLTGLIIASFLLIGAGGVLFAWKRKKVPGPADLVASIENDMAVLTGSFDSLEHSMKSMTRDIGKFITESNHWLAHQGYKHGFR